MLRLEGRGRAGDGPLRRDDLRAQRLEHFSRFLPPGLDHRDHSIQIEIKVWFQKIPRQIEQFGFMLSQIQLLIVKFVI